MPDLSDEIMSDLRGALEDRNQSEAEETTEEPHEGESRVERDWRNEDEDEQEQDGQDGDEQDGEQDGDGQEGNGQEGNEQEGENDEGEAQEGEGEAQDSEGESEDAEGEAQNSEGDPSGEADGESNNDPDGDPDGQPEGQPGGQSQSKSGGSDMGQSISEEQAQQMREDRDLSSLDMPSEEEKKSEEQKNREEEAQALNDEAFGEGEETSDWKKAQQEAASGKRVTTGVDESKGEVYTDNHYDNSAENIEESIQDFAYQINENSVGTDWTPQQIKDHKLATMFALMVSKVAEDMSYTKTDGDRFWDTHEIMKRQVTKKPLHQCRHDYEKSRLALLVDTSPSCRDEAIFYSKIAAGAMLRDDIDIFLCPNGEIDAKFDREKMRFMTDDRDENWDLGGRVVIYFTDWDGRKAIIDNSKRSKIYWMDNTTDLWGDDRERYTQTRYQFEGEHFEVPDQEEFKRVARKIRP